MQIVLGAGLAGLSCAYHFGWEQTIVIEKNGYAGGHIHADRRDGFTWDEGPHVSFTPHTYVRELFEQGVNNKFEEYPVVAGNYFKGHWIEHPAQTNLYQVPEPLRAECLKSFLETRQKVDNKQNAPGPANYSDWLHAAFGSVFAEKFPAPYTRKYWTVDPKELTTEWIGKRVYYPNVDDVIQGVLGPLDRSTHYIKKVRYPSQGGFYSFAGQLLNAEKIQYGAEVVAIELDEKWIQLQNGNRISFSSLINTMPLPAFIQRCCRTSDKVKEAARALACTSVLLVNVTCPHATIRKENWIYVYDEDMLSSRIYCTEKMSPSNAPYGWTGIQVEVYFGPTCRPDTSPAKIAEKVVQELIQIGLIDPDKAGGLDNITFTTRWVPWANVIFHHQTREAMDVIWTWLESKGLTREEDDLHPLTDWDIKKSTSTLGSIAMAGRFGQWKYFWTDDCVLRGKWLAG